MICVIMISSQDGLISSAAADRNPAVVATFLDHRRMKHSTVGSVFAAWHLLSLDAPTVAVLWTLFAAAVTHTRLRPAIPISMALAVWTIYVWDRLLDAKHIGPYLQTDRTHHLELRHLFHHQHRLAFTAVTAGCIGGLAMFLPLLPVPAFRLYLLEGVVMAGYFVLIHTAPVSIPNTRSMLSVPAYRIPKELLLGPFFAIATLIPTVSGRPELWLEMLLPAILFAALCSLNCLYIFTWESSGRSEPHWTTTFFMRHLNCLTWLYIGAAFACTFLSGASTQVSRLALYPLACAASGLLLAAVHKYRRNFSRLTLRTAADAALLTPLLILPFFFLHQP